jgi:predicted HicB family RNase H-like nuclease
VASRVSRHTVRIPQSLAAELGRLAARQGQSVAGYVSDVLRDARRRVEPREALVQVRVPLSAGLRKELERCANASGRNLANWIAEVLELHVASSKKRG